MRVPHKYDLGDQVRFWEGKIERIGSVVQVKARTKQKNGVYVLDADSPVSYRIEGSVKFYLEHFLVLFEKE